jgi:hypothetical protein
MPRVGKRLNREGELLGFGLCSDRLAAAIADAVAARELRDLRPDRLAKA